MGIEDDTFRLTEVQGDSEYALHSDDKTAQLTFDYAVWVNTGGRENRLGFYSEGLMQYSIELSAIDITDEELDEIILD